MDADTKKMQIAAAWAAYRARIARLPREIPWLDYVVADDRAFREYLSEERAILNAK